MATRPAKTNSQKPTVDLFDKCHQYTYAREVMAEGVFPFFQPIERSFDTEVVMGGERKLMLGSNNYLGLTHHPYVIERAKAALDRYGTGCTGSRVLNGTLDMHNELEARLAPFMGQESAVVFSTGYQTNLGIISALVDRGTVILQDKLNHASLMDAAALSGARMHRFPHGNLLSLRRLLDRHADAPGGVLVVTDGVFSMEGTVADLPAVASLAREYNARLLVDDAHGIGVLGSQGGGTAQYFGIEDKVDLVMATFSKSFASVGGVAAGSEPVIHYIKHNARSFLFSASVPPSAVATVLACLDIIEREPERLRAMWDNTRYLRAGLQELGFDTGASSTPIIPVVTGTPERTFALWRRLFHAGVFTNPVLPPAVPPSACCLRASVTATHTREQLDEALDAFAAVRDEVEPAPA